MQNPFDGRDPVEARERIDSYSLRHINKQAKKPPLMADELDEQQREQEPDALQAERGPNEVLHKVENSESAVDAGFKFALVNWAERSFDSDEKKFKMIVRSTEDKLI